MKKETKNNGFTLIEMLVVIAVVAILVALIIPTVSDSTVKAKASTDAANLRSCLATLNIRVMEANDSIETAVASMTFPECKSFEGAQVKIQYAPSHYIRLFYVVGSNYYGVDYFSEVAQTGSSTKTAKPEDPAASWYPDGE